jgi:hypothetical protein
MRLRSTVSRVVLAFGLVGAGAASCSQVEPENGKPHRSEYWSHSPPVCGVDEVREYYCEDLLPLRSSLPAPPPYDNCPGVVEGHIGELDPTPKVAVFDTSYTEYIRKRQPPGHSCCFSWCASVPQADPRAVDPSARCDHVRAMRETYCFDEPEGGTRIPGNNSYDRCPGAIVPPEGEVFFSPPGALLDPILTGQRRGQGFRNCCYAWCTVGPPGMNAFKE